MRSLAELISATRNDPKAELSPEDILSDAPGVIFTDDIKDMHGDEDTALIYDNAILGQITLSLSAEKGHTDGARFGHYLWNAGILTAEKICGLRVQDDEIVTWSVKDQAVLELGAGSGLTGLVAAKAGAKEVVISDYPAPDMLQNIQRNVDSNIPEQQRQLVKVQGHEWGVFTTDFAHSNKGRFTRVLAADCYWMPDVHAQLVQSMLYFLADGEHAHILVVAGFHTCRENLCHFFDTAVEQGLVVREIYEEHAEGQRRPWARNVDYPGERDRTQRKKWLVVAVLVRAQP